MIPGVNLGLQDVVAIVTGGSCGPMPIHEVLGAEEMAGRVERRTNYMPRKWGGFP